MLRRSFIIFGYVFAALIIVVGTILLIAYGNGYSYDWKSKRLVHNGLIILESVPSGANITFDGRKLRQKTPYRNTFEAGSYDFSISKDGYRSWHKRLEAVASRVTLAQYAILLRNRPQIESIGSFNSISQFSASRDRRRVGFVVSGGTDAGVWMLNTGNRQATRIYSSGPGEVVEITDWADDASHLLIKSQSPTNQSMIVIAASGNDAPINLTDTFKLGFTTLTFNPSNWRELYWVSEGGLRRLDVGAQTVSAVLAGNVAAFTFAEDKVVYIDADKPVRSLWSLDRSGRKQKISDKVPAAQSYEMAFATYIDTPMIAMVALPSRSVTLFSHVFDREPSAKVIPATADHVSFNGDGRFLMLGSAEGISSYDLELGKLYSFPSLEGPISGLNWFDNYHVLFNQNGQTKISEFDGQNSAVLAAAGSLPAFSSSDTKFVLVPLVSPNGVQIKSIRIRQ